MQKQPPSELSGNSWRTLFPLSEVNIAEKGVQKEEYPAPGTTPRNVSISSCKCIWWMVFYCHSHSQSPELLSADHLSCQRLEGWDVAPGQGSVKLYL